MKALKLCLLLSLVSPVLATNPQVRNITTGLTTKSMVHVYFTTIVPPNTATVNYGTTTALGSSFTYGPEDTETSIWFGGLAPATTYYYDICATNGSDTDCEPGTPIKVITATGTLTPDIPRTVVATDSYTVPSGGTTWTVASDCSDLQSKWDSATWGDIVEIPAGTRCKSFDAYDFSTATKGSNPSGKYIMLHTQGTTDSQTRVTPSQASNFATIVHTHPATLNDSRDFTNPIYQASCYAGGLYWLQNDPTLQWRLYQCQNDGNPQLIPSVPSVGIATFTLTGHGYPYNGFGWITGCTGPGAGIYNGVQYIEIIDSNTLEITDQFGNPRISTGAASNCSIQFNVWEKTPVTEVSSDPGTCSTWGQYIHISSSVAGPDQYHRNYYCDQDLKTVPLMMDQNDGLNAGRAPVQMTTTTSHVIFSNLSFDTIHLKYNPQTLEYGGEPGFESEVQQSMDDDHVYFNQVYAQFQEPSPTGSLFTMHAFAQLWDGSNIGVTNSYITGINSVHSEADFTDTDAIILNDQLGSGPFKISNNYFECTGICVYFSDENVTFASPHDLTFTNNTVETPDRFWSHSPLWIGNAFPNPLLQPHFPSRHRLEFKHMQGANINGNYFYGGYQFSNQAAAICLCPRGQGVPQTASIIGSTVTLYGQQDGYNDYRFPLASTNVGDIVYLHDASCPAVTNSTYSIVSILGETQVVISSVTPCNNSYSYGLGIQRLNSLGSQVRDISITNNIFDNTPVGIDQLGHDGYVSDPSLGSRVVYIDNNIFRSIDQTKIEDSEYSYSNPGLSPGGKAYLTIIGTHDLTFKHNTVYPIVNTALTASQCMFDSDTECAGFFPDSNLDMSYNIMQQPLTGGSIMNCNDTGTSALNNAWQSGISSPVWNYGTNVIISASDPTSHYTLNASSTAWFNVVNPLPFKNEPAGDYTLTEDYRSTDSCWGTPGDCTNDGMDVGVNMPALIAAQGSNYPFQSAANQCTISGNAILKGSAIIY